MNKDKQIDMITELLIDFDEMGFAPTTLCPDSEAYAVKWRKKLTEELKGYRKAEDVAREIFEEIEKTREDCTLTVDDRDYFQLTKFEKNIAELKKKYTEGENNDG